jgi:predicted O-linked N-acetylglucosamine transferase (SPINDLY family)
LKPQPDSAEANKIRGNEQKAAGYFEAAAASYRRALELEPGYLPARYNLGLVLRQMNQLEEAEAQFRAVIAADPHDAEALFHLAALLSAKSRYAEALQVFRDALQLTPENPNLWMALGQTHAQNGALDKVLRCFETAVRLQPDNPSFRGALLYEMQRACDWSRFEEFADRQRRCVREGADAEIMPFSLLSIPSTPEEQLQCAASFARRQLREIARDRTYRFERRAKSRLRIGYLSADFREHAMAHLMAELFELHDRGGYEIFGYSCGPDDASAMRARLLHAFDRFIDISTLPRAAAADRIYADGVDILVDLMGYTAGAAVEIVELRPSPVQVSYLGYPGTLGADFIDYLVSDAFLTPPGDDRHFSEQLVIMPASYQVNDRKRPVAQTPPRRELGLPDGAFVFCCFNHSYKILPEMFAAWMRLLAAVPHSVLWLLDSSLLAKDNLRREAQARGVAPERLVFAPMLPHAQHLGRVRAADLFLDTFPYNAHTTASDALWVGVPLVTRAGDTFASRVAGSLLSAVGLPELITRSAAEYEALALRLARAPRELKALREKLQRNRATAALFDTPAFARNLEAAYSQMWENYLSGSGPRSIRL